MIQVLNVSLTADGSTWDFETISVSEIYIRHVLCKVSVRSCSFKLAGFCKQFYSLYEIHTSTQEHETLPS